jgi:predicted nuclease with TOPRIM domain
MTTWTKKPLREILTEMGYESPEELVKSRTAEDQEYIQYLIKKLAKTEKEYEELKAEIEALRKDIKYLSDPDTDPFEMQDALKKWREIYELESTNSRVDLHQIIDREDTNYLVHRDGHIIRTITTYYADGSSSMQSFTGI